MTRILMIGEQAETIGGVERYLVQMAGILRRHNCQVDVAFEFPGRTAAPAGMTSEFDAVRTVGELRQLKTWPYDWVIVHRVRSGGLLAFLEKRGKVALVVHDHEYYCPRRSYYRPFSCQNCRRKYAWYYCSFCASLRRWRKPGDLFRVWFGFGALLKKLKKADKLLVLSEFMRQNLLKQNCPATAICVIAPAIAPGPKRTETMSANNKDLPLVLGFGQLIKGKGFDQMLAALALVKTPYRGLLIGHGSQKDKLQKQLDKMALPVKILDWTNHLDEYLSQAQVTVLPQRWQEPFGLTGAEALAFECPLAGFAFGGVTEYLHDGETGLTAEPGDLAQLAKQIDRLLAEPELARKLGQNGRKLIVEKFNEAQFWQKLTAALDLEVEA